MANILNLNKKFKVGLFFDDSRYNFIDCHKIPNVIPILVKTNPKLSLDNFNVKTSDFLREINKFLKDQKKKTHKIKQIFKKKHKKERK